MPTDVLPHPVVCAQIACFLHSMSHIVAELFFLREMFQSGIEEPLQVIMPLCGRWFDGGIARTFRGSMHYDGGLTNFIPVWTTF